jgi:hypothetical protein
MVALDLFNIAIADTIITPDSLPEQILMSAPDKAPATDYERLRSWYLARLRRGQLEELDSARLNPSLLLEADREKLHHVALAAEDTQPQKPEWSNLLRRASAQVQVSVLSAAIVAWASCIFLYIMAIDSEMKLLAAAAAVFFILFNGCCVFCKNEVFGKVLQLDADAAGKRSATVSEGDEPA